MVHFFGENCENSKTNTQIKSKYIVHNSQIVLQKQNASKNRSSISSYFLKLQTTFKMVKFPTIFKMGLFHMEKASLF